MTIVNAQSFPMSALSQNLDIKSSFLPDDFKISSQTSEIEGLLWQCMNNRLGPSMLSKTAKNMNTKKVEGMNRAIRTTMAKNVTYQKTL